MTVRQFDKAGEIISWSAPSGVHIDTLRAAAIDADIDPALFKDMRPSNAFRRAMHAMEENRIIRQTRGDAKWLYFQLTHEALISGEFHYSKETELKVAKDSGAVICDERDLEAFAQNLVDQQMDHRYANDITRMIQKLFESNGDLISIRPAGGCYFVPEQHTGLCDKVERFLQSIGGDASRWEQFASERNKQNAAAAIRDQINGMIAEYKTYVTDLDLSNQSKANRAAKRIADIRLKLECYRGVLSDYSKDIETAVASASSDLQRYVAGDLPLPVSPPAVLPPEPVSEPDEEEDDDESDPVTDALAALAALS
jgi:hypothetical protein